MEKELRLDNLLSHGGEVVKVSAIFKSYFNCETLYGVVLGNSAQNGFKPVPLTEKWLGILGFELLTFEIYTIVIDFNIHMYSLQVEKANNGWLVGVTRPTSNGIRASIPLRIITDIHELQNLYFSLTTTELIIK